MISTVTNDRPATRVCLKCNKPFWSKGPGNRICRPCTQINKKLGPIPEACIAKQRGEKRHNGLPMGLAEDDED